MPSALVSNTAVQAVAIGLAGVLAGILAVLLYRKWSRSRISPAERERRRRALLVARGKMGDATVVEYRDDLLFFSYSVRGVEYIASQDTSTLKALLPPDLCSVGAAWVKYDPKNPANSIVISEDWNGLQTSKVG